MKIQLKRSNVLVTGTAKAPTAEQMEYGELAVNYNNEDPVIFIKDSDNNIIRLTNVNEEVEWDDILDKPAIPGFDDIPDVYNGQININAAVNGGITAAGSNATANQSGNTTRTLSVDTTWLQSFLDGQGTADKYLSKVTNDHAAGSISIGNTVADPKISLNSDGSITAAGKGLFTGEVETDVWFLSKQASAGYAGLYLYNTSGSLRTDTAAMISNTANSGGETLSLGYDGSITAAGGAIELNSAESKWTSTYGETYVTGNLGGDVCAYGHYSTAASAWVYKVKDDGSIVSAGNISAHEELKLTGSESSVRINNNAGDLSISLLGTTGSAEDFVTIERLTGDITAAGDVQIGDDASGALNAGVFIANTGRVTAASTPGTQPLWSGYLVGNTNATSLIKADGSITAAGSVTVGTYNSTASDTTGGEVSSLGKFVAQRKSTEGPSDVFAGYQGTSKNFYVTANGSATFAGQVDALSLNSTSDITLKKDITPIENAVSKLSSVNGVGFAWKKNDERTYGVIAQDVEKEFPELVSTKDFKSVNYNGLVGVLIEAVKELNVKVEVLNAEIEKLKNR